MEIINLKKYLTPLEIKTGKNKLDVNIFSDIIINESGFYNSIFKRKVGNLRKRLFVISKKGKVIATINSLIPQAEIVDKKARDVESAVDKDKKVGTIRYDIMLTWPNDEEKQLLVKNRSITNLQVLLRKSLFVSKSHEVIRYEEDTMLPDYFSLQKK